MNSNATEMPLRLHRFSAVTVANNLYQVPRRRVPLRRHLPAGRTLHLVDLENLMGGPRMGREKLVETANLYRDLAPVRASDHMIVATNPALALEVAETLPGAQLRFGKGANGADYALLAALPPARDIAARFDRVVLGSGDGIFTPTIAEIRSFGIAVGIVARPSSISLLLSQTADFIRYIPDYSHTWDAA